MTSDVTLGRSWQFEVPRLGVANIDAKSHARTATRWFRHTYRRRSAMPVEVPPKTCAVEGKAAEQQRPKHHC